jgi:hypothetical protein
MARRLASRLGLIALLDRHRGRRWCLYLRSLFSIYDVTDMLRLDVPWWSFAAIDRVEQFLRERDGKARVFEYGAGASTAWLARRSGQVISVEHDARFVASMKQLLSDLPNVALWHRPPSASQGIPSASSTRRGYVGFDFSDYVRAIEDAGGLFDLIVIDGRARASCLPVAIGHLAPAGIIVFDNSERTVYAAALSSSGLKRAAYRDWTPSLPYKSETSLLYRDAGLERTQPSNGEPGRKRIGQPLIGRQ